MVTTTVSSGQTSSGNTIASGNTENVLFGGTAISNAINSGGQINNSGTTISTRIAAAGANGGLEVVLAGGVSSNTIITSGAMILSAGAQGPILSGGGLVVSSGGIAIGATATRGSTAVIVATGGATSGTILLSAREIVQAGGTASGTIVRADAIEALWGGTSFNDVVSSGGSINVQTGGIASGTTVISGSLTPWGNNVPTSGAGMQVLSGGIAIGTIASGGVASASSVEVRSGGVTTGTILLNAREGVEVGGVASGTIVSSGSVEANWGSTFGAVISTGGFENVWGGGHATGMTVLDGGIVNVGVADSTGNVGGIVSNTTVSSGGVVNVGSGAVASNTNVLAGGSANISSGAIAIASGGSTNGVTVLSGGVLQVSSGGFASSNIIRLGGRERVFAGGSSTGDAINSGSLIFSSAATGVFTATGGGGLLVETGAVATNAVVTGGGNTNLSLLVSSGGTIEGTTVTDARAAVNSGAVANGTVIGSGGVQAEWGTDSGTVVSSGGIENVWYTGVGNAITVLAGGNATANASAGLVGVVNNAIISSGGILTVNTGASASSATIESGGRLTVAAANATIAGTHLISGGAIDLNYATFAAGATATLDASTDVLTIVDGGVTRTTQLSGDYTGQTFLVSSDTDKSTLVTVVCFLADTMIATPSGERAVQDLVGGDAVTVVEHGQYVSRPVTWVGSRAVRAGELGDSTEAFPVRIRRHAFADNVPHRDLLVTPEHCVLTEAGLTPVRMLVNDTTIIVDRSVADYEFFHIELEHHGILLAEGLTTESYIDTGNRGLFVDAGAVVTVSNDVVLAAPLAVSRELVEPVWTQLVERAQQLGFETSERTVALTDQPDLRLLLDTGRELSACWHNEQRYMFRIPGGATPMRLLSRTGVPAETVGPFVDDRRTLGVAVDKLVLWTGLDGTVLPAADMALNGWYGDEGDRRWTNGDAQLDLPRAGIETFLDVHVVGTTLYRQDATLTT